MTGRVPTGVRHLVLGRAEKLPVWHGAVQLRLQQRQAGGQISHANSSTKHVAKASRRASSMSQAATAAVFSSYGRSAGGDSASSDRIGFAYPRGAATTTGCPCAGSRCECAAFAGRGHNTRWSSLAIERTQRIASTGLAQTAIVIGHKAQIGRLPIACSPFAPGNRISVCGQQPVPDRQRPRSGTRADDRASVGRGVSRLW